jgi:GNAT superfamily N-acetyltransferase
MSDGYRVVRAEAAHVPALPAIEVAAAGLFSPEDVPPAMAAEPTALADLAAGQRDGRLFVALAPDGALVGFALLGSRDGHAHLLEIDVRPDHGGRGVGTALLRAVFAAAASDGHREMTLTTFSHVPWNAPFYARMGFRALAPGELGPELRATLAKEVERGLDPARRVAMRRPLP